MVSTICYQRRELINIIIQVVRLLSVALILVFVEELGINQSSKTITGVVLIALQSSLTALLALLIAINAIVICVRENPHRKRRKEAGECKITAARSLAIMTARRETKSRYG